MPAKKKRKQVSSDELEGAGGKGEEEELVGGWRSD